MAAFCQSHFVHNGIDESIFFFNNSIHRKIKTGIKFEIIEYVSRVGEEC